MRKIENTKSIPENFVTLQSLIGNHVDSLSFDRVKNQKKILELCHAGKFLMLINSSFEIEKLSETPDFILVKDEQRIGLEHQIVIDEVAKQREGLIENVFAHAEKELQSENELPNFLANCMLKPGFQFKLADKARIKNEIKRVVKHFVLTNTLIPNRIIYHLSTMPHSEISVNANLGAWGQKIITAELIQKAVAAKEKKLLDYRSKGAPVQWLLLVIGSLKESSYEVEGDLKVDLNTGFDKVYLLEDFRNRLYEIK